ncbi:hypothetical protein W01_12030 [Candidatus Nitrotoga sp. AM1P]|nr:hypothetical protein W01_12030 [Candidatus Nitrotoga sp. AM1P]
MGIVRHNGLHHLIERQWYKLYFYVQLFGKKINELELEFRIYTILTWHYDDR